MAKTTKAILSCMPLGGVTLWAVMGLRKMMGQSFRRRVILPDCQYCRLFLLLCCIPKFSLRFRKD